MKQPSIGFPLTRKRRWSARRTLAFIILSSATLWVALVLGGVTAHHHFF